MQIYNLTVIYAAAPSIGRATPIVRLDELLAKTLRLQQVHFVATRHSFYKWFFCLFKYILHNLMHDTGYKGGHWKFDVSQASRARIIRR